jgi:hypothetical protein
MGPKPPQPKRSPEELKKFRQELMRKMTAKKMANVKARRSPRCHPDRPQVDKTGLCYECFVGGDAAKQLSIADATKLIDKHASGKAGEALKAKALALLMENLPEYALLHREGAKIAALKGDTKPAEWALTTIKELGGTAVLEPPAKTAAPTEGKFQIMVGVNLGNGTPTASLAASNVVEADVRTSE